jgi:DNA-binding SARP family transcriptional activator
VGHVKFSILGEISVIINGSAIQLGELQRAILAILLHRANRVVHRSEIIDLAWGD